jgi:hypothetical protein
MQDFALSLGVERGNPARAKPQVGGRQNQVIHGDRHVYVVVVLAIFSDPALGWNPKREHVKISADL